MEESLAASGSISGDSSGGTSGGDGVTAPASQRPNKYVIGYAFCAGVNSTLLGYDIGVFGGAMTFVVRIQLQT